MSNMSNISRFVVWICRKFSRQQIEKIIEELSMTLKNPNAEVKPRDEFEQEHPNYRDYHPDPNAALTESQLPTASTKKKRQKKRKPTTR